MKLSQNQRKELERQLRPLFDGYYDHSYGWGSVGEADDFTRKLINILGGYGVRIFG